MPKQNKVLVVGTVNNFGISALCGDSEIKLAANYEEAIELLNTHEFDHVITDAELPDDESAMDILRAVKIIKTPFKVLVCHTDPVCVANGRRWWIETGLGHFPGASFYQGTLLDGLSQVVGRLLKTA